jgi:hypothetical protein
MPGPADPFGQLMEAATSTHEMFRSYVAAGFTDSQALYLTGVIISAALRNASQPPEGP